LRGRGVRPARHARSAKAPDAVGFYSIIAAATPAGFALGYTPISPIQMLIWSAVLNGLLLFRS
jgi:hypothetical protein